MSRLKIIMLGIVLMLLIGACCGQTVNAGGSRTGANQNIGQSASQSFYGSALNNTTYYQNIAQNANQNIRNMQTQGNGTNVGTATGAVGSSANAASGGNAVGATAAGTNPSLGNTGTAGNVSQQQPPQISIYCVNKGCSEQKVMFGAGTLARGCYRSQSECMSALSQQNTSQQIPGNSTGNNTGNNTGNSGQQIPGGSTGNSGTPVIYYPGPYYYYPGSYYPGMYYPFAYGTSYSSTSSMNVAATTGTAYGTVNPAGTGTAGNVTPSIIVADQTVAGNSILVASVTADAPGWIVIHNNLNGAPGGIIGFAHVNAGTTTNVSVPIDPKLATTALFAELHSDLGNPGSFEYPGPDVAVIGPNGMPVMASFRVNLPVQTAGTTGTAGYTTGQAAPVNVGTPVQPIVISYGAPSSNIGNQGVTQLGAGTTEGTPLATYPVATYPITTAGNTGTGTNVNSANGVSTVNGNGAGTTTSY